MSISKLNPVFSSALTQYSPPAGDNSALLSAKRRIQSLSRHLSPNFTKKTEEPEEETPLLSTAPCAGTIETKKEAEKLVVFSYEDLTQTSRKGHLPEFMAKHGISGTFQERMGQLIEMARHGTTQPPFDSSKYGERSFAIDMGMRGLDKKDANEDKAKAPNHLTAIISYTPPDGITCHSLNGSYYIRINGPQEHDYNGIRGHFELDGQSGHLHSLDKNQYRGSELLALWNGLCALLGVSNVSVQDAAGVTCHHEECDYKGGDKKFELRYLRTFTEKNSKAFYESRGYEPIDLKKHPEIDGDSMEDHPSPSAYHTAKSYLSDQKMGNIFKMFLAIEKSVEVAPKTLEVLRKAKNLTKAEDSTPIAEVIRKVYTIFRSSTCDKETHLLMHELYDHIVEPTQLANQLTEKLVTDPTLRSNPLVTDLALMLLTKATIGNTSRFKKRTFSPLG